MKKHFHLFILSFIVVTVFFVSLVVHVDSDFGWHLRTGQWIISNRQIPATDLTSHSAPNYPYTYHSWLAELIYALLYPLGQRFIISILLASLVTCGFAILILQTKPSLYHLSIPILAVFLLYLTGSSLRIQAFTFLGLTILSTLLHHNHSPPQKFKTYPSWLVATKTWLLFPLFTLWANLHGGFIIGLGYFALFALILPTTSDVEFADVKKHITYFFLTLLLTFLFTLINPYGIKLHQFTLSMFTNSTALTINTDWMPQFAQSSRASQLSFLFLIIFSLLTISISKISQQRKIILAFLLFLSIFINRLIILLIIELTTLLPNTLKSLNHYRFIGLPSGKVILTLLIPFPLILAFNCASNFFYGSYSPASLAIYSSNTGLNYPYNALRSLSGTNFTPNLFNNFNWGGFISYVNPNIKVFVDGKMDNYYEGDKSFLQIYRDIMLEQDGWQQQLDKYQINTILLSTYDGIVDTLSKSPIWRQTYQDDTSIIFVRTHPIPLN